MKKRKLKKKNVIILSIIVVILLIEVINPIKLYNEYVLRNLNYSETSIKTILDNGMKDEVLSHEYNKALDIILSSKLYKKENHDIYKDLIFYDYDNFTDNVNKLIEKGYQATDINNILKTSQKTGLDYILETDYVENISDYLQYDFAISSNINRYIAYQRENVLENELVVVYVNIGLDKEFYEDPNTVDAFSIDILVNKYNGVSKDFVPEDLITFDSKYAVDSKQKGNEEMALSFMKMSDDCKKNTGYKLLVRSGYRDYESQQSTYDTYLKTYGKNYAESYVTHAGFSEHQTGLALDIKAESSNTFAGTKESKWLSENAYIYGFILRYESDTEDITGIKYEAWHYRYVGVSIATYIHENNMTFDEYYIRFLNK